ncbi:MAG TPA: hypothetical protein VGH98_02880 [Gemmatimonadaceae bacterium]|jgi:hypothetical protein
MIAVSLVLITLAGTARAPNDTGWISASPPDSAASAVLGPIITRALLPVDTPVVRRPLAIEYSDAYYTRLTIHRIGSYTMLPLFAAEYSLGQNLIQDVSPPTWMKPTHALVAGGIGVLFGINTITGVWNLWDSRKDPEGRTRRIVHSVLMLASDAGFAAAGATAPGHHHDYLDYGNYQHQVNLHRGIAIGSIAASTIGGVMMWFWK